MKLGSEFRDLYYPSGWDYVGSLVFIIILYVPTFALYVVNGHMLNTCIRRIHPQYDFETGKLEVKADSQPENTQSEDSHLLRR